MVVKDLVKVLEKNFSRQRRLSKNGLRIAPRALGEEIICFLEKIKACEVVKSLDCVDSSQGFLRILGPGKKNFFFFFWEKKTQEVGKYPLRKIFFCVRSVTHGFENGKDLHWKKIFLSIYTKSWISPKKWPKNVRSVTHAKYLIFQEVKKKNFPNVQKMSVVSRFFCLSWKIGFFEIFLSVESRSTLFFFTSWNIKYFDIWFTCFFLSWKIGFFDIFFSKNF